MASAANRWRAGCASCGPDASSIAYRYTATMTGVITQLHPGCVVLLQRHNLLRTLVEREISATAVETIVLDEQEQQQPSKFHRGQDMEVEASVETSCDDAARAAKLHKEQQAAIDAAREANATFGDETSMHIAGQLYAHKVELVRARAQAIGIVPTCEGRQLIELQPDDLNRWVREVLAPAESKKKENYDADY